MKRELSLDECLIFKLGKFRTSIAKAITALEFHCRTKGHGAAFDRDFEALCALRYALTYYPKKDLSIQ